MVFSAYATRGPWVAYVRGESETAQSIPAYSLATREAIQQAMIFHESWLWAAMKPGTPQPSVGQFRLLDAYVGPHVVELGGYFREAESLVGSGRGWSVGFQRQRSADQHVQDQPDYTAKIAQLSRLAGADADGVLSGPARRAEFLIESVGFRRAVGSDTLNPQPFIHGQTSASSPPAIWSLVSSERRFTADPAIR